LATGLPATLSLAVLGIAAAACGTRTETERAYAGPRRVAHVRVDGLIDTGVAALLNRAIDRARADGAETLVIELDTPGGELDALWGVQKQLLAAEDGGLKLACWVHLHAASAGALVALCCSSIYMHEAGTIGSAHPVEDGPNGLESLPTEAGAREKVVSFLRSQFASMAESHGRPPSLAKAMVDPDVEVYQVRVDNELRLVDGDEYFVLRDQGTPYELVATIKAKDKILNLTAKQAVEMRLSDGMASSLEEVLGRLGSRPGDVTSTLESSASDRAVVWIERLTPLLILAALVLAYLELKLPGFGVPGILSITCFTIVLAGKYMAGLADVPHIVAVAAGLVLLVLEVLVFPGSLWFGITGAVLVAGGLVFASLGPGFTFSDPLLRERLLDTGLEYTAAAVGAVIVALLISRWLPKTPILRRVVLAPDPASAFAEAVIESTALPAIGTVGVALTALRPVGKVAVDARPGVEFEARSLGPLIPAGTRVRVIEVGEGRLVVEPLGARA
jgi:membrane-bound serine protease (ClpP class)